MKIRLRKVLYLSVALSVYVLLISAILTLLIAPGHIDKLFFWKKPIVTFSTEIESAQSLLETIGSTSPFSGVLLPLGPADGSLPGVSQFWKEYRGRNDVRKSDTVSDGFDGLQAVASIVDYSVGIVSEAFFPGTPLKVFRRGHMLYLLTGNQQVQVFDCKNPKKPRLIGPLPYQGVTYMEMQGPISFLLLERAGTPFGRMIVLDLETPGQPQELAQVELPKDSDAIFFENSQLVVFSSSKGFLGKTTLFLYDLDASFNLHLLGKVPDSPIGSRFIRYDDYLLVPGLRGGLSVYDVSRPLTPLYITSVDSPPIKHFVRYGNMVLATGLAGSLLSFDFNDPVQPFLSTVVEDVEHPAYLMSFGDYTYYFTFNGYLRVFDLPFETASEYEKPSEKYLGALTALAPGKGFSFLGEESLKEHFFHHGPLEIVDHIVWNGMLIVLDKGNMLHTFNIENNSSLTFLQELQLQVSARWLTSSKDRLYVGGKGTVSVFDRGDDRLLFVSGQVSLSGKQSWDGLVVKDTLCLALGRGGLLVYSLKAPDQPSAVSHWKILPPLDSLADLRHLSRADGDRLLMAAEDAGLVLGRIDAEGQFVLEGSLRFSSPVTAVTAVKDLCLVSIGAKIGVVDIRDSLSLQKLGEIAFPDVEKFVLSSPEMWAGFSNATGWVFLPTPRLLSPKELGRLKVNTMVADFEAEQERFRLSLFNDQGVKTVPGILSLPLFSRSSSMGGTHGLH